jgi:hypothetical protein
MLASVKIALEQYGLRVVSHVCFCCSCVKSCRDDSMLQPHVRCISCISCMSRTGVATVAGTWHAVSVWGG